MNPYIYSILLDKSKIEFLKDIHNGRPSCKQILQLLCSYYQISETNLLMSKRLKKHFVYLCYKIHDPEFINLIKEDIRYHRRAKNGIRKDINCLMLKKKHPHLLNMLKCELNYIKIYRDIREEVLSLERNLHTCWRGGW